MQKCVSARSPGGVKFRNGGFLARARTCFSIPLSCQKMASDQVKILKEKAKEAIDIYSPELYELNKSVWENPELGLQERFAHDQLTEFLADQGFDVIPHYTLDTAFRAECGEDGGLTIGLISEYDALPEVGHACGHNLIAESGVAAALGMFTLSFACRTSTCPIKRSIFMGRVLTYFLVYFLN